MLLKKKMGELVEMVLRLRCRNGQINCPVNVNANGYTLNITSPRPSSQYSAYITNCNGFVHVKIRKIENNVEM